MELLAVTSTLAAAGSPAQADAVSVRSAPSLMMRSIRKFPKDDPRRVPHPSHRHASPSAPWPWVDLEDEVDPEQLECDLPPVPPLCDHIECGGCWTGYPQSRFPNWTYRQVTKSKIQRAITQYSKDTPCVCHRVDVDTSGFFTNPGPIVAKHGDEALTWERLITEKTPSNIRVRALFIENMSGPILQMLGAKFNIEPFFWSSSLNWIPSRFQEEIQPGIGDHITITLTFLKSMSNYDAVQMDAALNKDNDSVKAKPSTFLGSQNIDTHAPLILYSNDRLLHLDLLAVHLIRNRNGSTVISYHPTMSLPTTTAPFFHQRIRFAGQSVYWQSIFQKSPDPTFVLITFIWHAVYAWDEALEDLYKHICTLESRVITTTEMLLTRELHVIRAHHLHYTSLLEDFKKHVDFIRDTHNPAMDSDDLTDEDREFSDGLLKRECANLQSEIQRLQQDLRMQEKRLKNVMGLVFSTVNIEDSKLMKNMTEAAVRDSAAMKQIAYLTMVFLPASFVAGVFGMNVVEINPGTFGTLAHYFEVALPLTLLTTWVIVAFQSDYIFKDKKGISLFHRLAWPFFLMYNLLQLKKKKKEEEELDDKISEFDYSVALETPGASTEKARFF